MDFWIRGLRVYCHVNAAKVTGFEIKYLVELGNLYPENEFRAMLKAYGEDHEANGKPWRLFDEFYKCHAHWRSKARVSVGKTEEEMLADLLKDESKFEALDNARNANGHSSGNQVSNEFTGRVHS